MKNQGNTIIPQGCCIAPQCTFGWCVWYVYYENATGADEADEKLTAMGLEKLGCMHAVGETPGLGFRAALILPISRRKGSQRLVKKDYYTSAVSFCRKKSRIGASSRMTEPTKGHEDPLPQIATSYPSEQTTKDNWAAYPSANLTSAKKMR